MTPRPPNQGPGEGEVRTLIDELLADQRRLTAVEKFSRLHDHSGQPLLAAHYRDLIPLNAPRPGEQYAFEVNLDQCSGCKACVTACHSLNGLDEDESWREVGVLFGSTSLAVPGGGSAGQSAFHYDHGRHVIPLQQTVTTACHHCVEPACLLGCPVLAYDKDPGTGIVRHLDDQCIGCSYCILKCPYDVPKYSAKRGIVRKCDMCHGRLAEGEAPACVQACPNEAIRITLVKPAAVSIEFRSPSRNRTSTASVPEWLPDSPAPAITLPTTRYRSARPNATLRSADHAEPQPQSAHWPLIFMLVLTQAGIGGLVVAAFLSLTSGLSAGLLDANHFRDWNHGLTAPRLAVAAFVFFVAGLVVSVFHLGQPKKAWRVWLGWRTSWLSREAIVLNAFAGLAMAALVGLWAGKVVGDPRLPASLAALLQRVSEVPGSLWAGPLVLLGLSALFTQTMVYADTRREFWRFGLAGPRFLGTATQLGLALLLTVTAFTHPAGLPPTAIALVGVVLLKLAFEASVLKHADTDSDRWTQLRRTAFLQRGRLRHVLSGRMLLGIIGGAVLPFALGIGAAAPASVWLVLPLCLAGEVAERHLFFTSVSPDKMPGLP